MPLTPQLIATTYDEVIKERNAAYDQWSDSSFLKYLEKIGGVSRRPGGAALTPILDYKANPAVDFLATDTTATSKTKTDVITNASYNWVGLVAPVNWTLMDEALNSTPNQKVDLVTGIVNNAIASHDQAVEKGTFSATATDGFLSLPLLFPANGQGVVGTVDSVAELWWRSQFGTWAAATIAADLTAVWNKCLRGSYGRSPNVVVTSAVGHATLEAVAQPQQRWGKEDTTARVGFKAMQFKTADVIFSMECALDDFYLFNTADTKLMVATDAWRERRTPIEHVDAAMMNMKVFSVLQWVSAKRSGGGVVKDATP